ncbi:MAG: hypothetical protein LBR69_00725 [Endomicrobium sp.]|jgi:hypothetical protein|nr:hypothetical protein [Endomicrobium sp.]
MNLKRITAVFTVLFLLQAQNVFAAKPPTQPNSYDGAPPMARSMAMGGAGAAFVPSHESYYYSSANLSNMAGGHIGAAVVALRTSDASPSRVSAADPSGQGLTAAYVIKDSGAFYWQALSDSHISYSDLDGGSHNVDTYINSLAFAMGQKNERGISFGLNISYLYGKIGESGFYGGGAQPYANIASGNGFAMDLSVMYPVAANVFVSMNFKNIAGFMFWDKYNVEQLPFTVRTGMAYVIGSSVLTMDWDKKFYRFGNLEENHYYMGMEQYLNRSICVRLGTAADSKFNMNTIKYTYGLGIRVRTYEFAFAGEQYNIDNKKFLKYILSLSASVF